jgi:hypothetical protein
MDQITPNSQSQQQPAQDPADPAGGDTVTVTKNPDGTFSVDGKPAKTLEEALALVQQALTGDDGGMSVEQAFRGGFQGAEMGGSGIPGDMGGRY